jgi:murein DD-endopeptidase MepM/ murein hydrolase activator NlpD
MQKKTPIILVASIGVALMAFQNCAGNMQASQTVDNMQSMEERRLADDSDLGNRRLMMAAITVSSPQFSCLASDLKFAWPLGGTPYKDWNVFNYVDDDTTTGAVDYMGAAGTSAVTYDAHRGIDIDVPDFRYMDADFPVLAAAGGKVVAIVQSSFDRNLKCSPDQWNHVTIRHKNGFLAVYGHLKQNSVVVQVGDTVVAGQKLAVVGSSGCSSYPHLHFEVMNCNNDLVDAMKQGMFTAPPMYSRQAPATLMQTVIKQPVLTSNLQMADPGADTLQVKRNVYFSMGMTVSNLKPGDHISTAIFDPSGVEKPYGYDFSNSTYFPQSNWYGNTYLDVPGVWRIDFKINGVVKSSRTISVL